MKLMADSSSINRDIRYDILRCIAALLVVLLHVAALVDAPVGSVLWSIAVFFNSLSRPCVPLFFMLTGAFILKRNIPISVLFKKKVLRLLIIYTAWSLIYLCLKNQSDVFRNGDILLFFKLLLQGEFHLWFLLVLAGIYMLHPVLYAMVHYEKGKCLPFYLIFFFIFGLAIPELNQYVSSILKINIHILKPEMCGYVGYVILGYYLANIKSVKISSLWLLSLLLGVSFVVFCVNYLAAQKWGEFYSISFSNATISTCVKAVALFLLCQNIPINAVKKQRIKEIVYKLSTLTFGVYLIHPYFLYKWIAMKNTPSDILWILLYIPIVCFIVSLCSFVSSGIMNRVPYLNRLIMMR